MCASSMSYEAAPTDAGPAWDTCNCSWGARPSWLQTILQKYVQLCVTYTIPGEELCVMRRSVHYEKTPK